MFTISGVKCNALSKPKVEEKTLEILVYIPV